MTLTQIHWAATHDWYVGVTSDGQGVLVNDAYTKNGALHQHTKVFTNFRALRRWAGY